MQIADNTVVQFNYSLKNEDGKVLETNAGEDPVAYLHGHKNMMVGVENSLAGKSQGDSFEVTLPAAETYGEYLENQEQRVSVKHLQGAKKWKAGMVAVLNTEHGHRQVTVLKVGKFMVTIDTNHPFAGKTLTFDMEVVAVREATQEEQAHGHAHGVGGHHH